MKNNLIDLGLLAGVVMMMLTFNSVAITLQKSKPTAVVRVHNDNKMESEHGSGVLIAPNLVLSCNHVFSENRPSSKVTIEFADGTKRPGKILKRDKRWDLSLVEIDPVLVPPCKIGDPVVPGQHVTFCGYPGNKAYAEREGPVLAFRSPGGAFEPLWFTVDAKAGSGFSGGPVFDDDGRVVGILFGSLDVSVCVGVEKINQFLSH